MRTSGYELRGGSRTTATSKMERFVITANGCKPLTIITRRSILDVAAVRDPRLELILVRVDHPSDKTRGSTLSSLYKQTIFDPRPKNCLSFSKKSPQEIV